MVWARRRFLGVMAALMGSRSGSSQTALAPGCKVFSPHRARTVEAIAEQIIPKDDTPGANDAGVLYYIDRALAGNLRRHRSKYLNGLGLVDEASRKKFGKDFVDLARDRQAEVLQTLEAGPGAGAEFFQLIRLHTMEGFYGHPRYGGNHNYLSWKMLGFKG